MKNSRSEHRIKQLKDIVKESLDTQAIFFSENWDNILKVFDTVVQILKKGGKLIIMGNGGSASDAQHLAAELVNRFRKNRPALPAIALTENSSIMTSISNDSDFRFVFSRQIEALAKPEDLVIGITTSGDSSNVLEGIMQATRMGIHTLALSGGDGGKVGNCATQALCVSSSQTTPRIQEAFLLLEHLLCEWIESELFPENETNKTD